MERTRVRLGEVVAGWAAPVAPWRMLLEGRSVRLEPLGLEHADGLHEANSADAAGAIWDYLPYGPFAQAEYRNWVERMARASDPLFFAIRDRETGLLAGVMSYLRITPQAGSIEIGHLCFAPRLQRNKAATEAVFLTMQWAFEAGYRRFEWKCDALNLRSRRAAQRYGLSYEGVFRQATIVKGRNRDTAWFAAIDKEWPALQAAFAQWLDPANFAADGRQRVRLGDLMQGILVNRDPALA